MSPIEYTDGVYRSPAQRPSVLARTFPAAVLYSVFFAIVFRANRLAVRGRYDRDGLCRSSLACLRLLERIGVRFEISGIQHIRDLEVPCVVIANHMSTLETVVLPGLIQPFRQVTFIVKESLLTYPVFGPIMRSLDPLPVTRTNPRQDLKTVLEGGVERLRQGASIVVFPQTTRTVTFAPALFTSIGIKLAQRASAPVVPLALLTDAWGNGRLLKEVGPVDPRRDVRFAFGEPLRVQARGSDQQQAIVRYISGKLSEWADARVARGLARPPIGPAA
jgi:1-acyl-sn-glycerol-3-phosphate acyltransferase